MLHAVRVLVMGCGGQTCVQANHYMRYTPLSSADSFKADHKHRQQHAATAESWMWLVRTQACLSAVNVTQHANLQNKSVTIIVGNLICRPIPVSMG